MRLITLAAAVFFSASAGTAFAASDVSLLDAPSMPLPASPMVQVFAQSAGMGNQYEITTSQIALENSQDPGVRRFAQLMMNDHHEAEMTLEHAAVPTGVNTHFMFDAAHQAKIEELQGLSGPAFDEAYWIVQRDAHADAVASIGNYRASGGDPSLQAWARETLPVVIEHQRMIADMTGTSAVALR